MRAALGVTATAFVFASGRAQRQDWIDRTLVTVDVTGTWARVGGGQPVTIVLEQQGPKVSGFLMTHGYNQIGTWRPLDGTVAGVLSFQVRDGRMTGNLTVTGEQMSGVARQSPPGAGPPPFELVLQRINSSSTLPSKP